jgi:hypothetical protein
MDFRAFSTLEKRCNGQDYAPVIYPKLPISRPKIQLKNGTIQSKKASSVLSNFIESQKNRIKSREEKRKPPSFRQLKLAVDKLTSPRRASLTVKPKGQDETPKLPQDLFKTIYHNEVIDEIGNLEIYGTESPKSVKKMPLTNQQFNLNLDEYPRQQLSPDVHTLRDCDNESQGSHIKNSLP